MRETYITSFGLNHFFLNLAHFTKPALPPLCTAQNLFEIYLY